MSQAAQNEAFHKEQQHDEPAHCEEIAGNESKFQPPTSLTAGQSEGFWVAALVSRWESFYCFKNWLKDGPSGPQAVLTWCYTCVNYVAVQTDVTLLHQRHNQTKFSCGNNALSSSP